MPTYKYECEKCGTHYEKFQKMTDKPLSKCKKCGAALKRLISATSGIIFKGSGFYQTDYKNADRKTDMPPKECAKNCDAPCRAANGK